MRVLLINQVFHPDPQATGQYLCRLAETLVRRGHEVTVLTGRHDYVDPALSYPPQETWRGIEIIRVWDSGFGHGAKWRRAADFFTFLVAALLRGLFLSRADVVIGLTTPPLLSVLGAALAGLWQARFIHWIMDINPDEAIAVGWLRKDSGLAYILEAMSCWSLRQAESVIVLDDYMGERVCAKGIAPEKVVTVPLWMLGEVRFDPQGRERFRREHGLADKFIVMYSGNHTPVHPLETLVEAARQLRDDPRIHFCFVGGGTEWTRLRDRAQAEMRGDNVTFLGYQPLETLSDSLSAADLQVVAMGDPFVGIVHPSKVYNFLAVERPFVFIGPKPCHVTDLIHAAGLESVTLSFRHGEQFGLQEEIRKRVGRETPAWPPKERFERWTEVVVVEKIVRLVETRRSIPLG